MKNRNRLLIIVLGFVISACSWTQSKKPEIDTSPPAGPITITAEVPNPPEPTQTPFRPLTLCVVAEEPVYLRTSPSSISYPNNPLIKGDQVTYKGLHDGGWYFVEYGDSVGWVHSFYLSECE